METWCKVNNGKIKEFERVEQQIFRRILKAHSETAIEALYLELGIIPLRYQLMKRRLLYCYSLMNRNDSETIKQVLFTQMKLTLKGDFWEQCILNMQEINIDFNSLFTLKQNSAKTIIENKIKIAAYAYLIELANNHPKTVSHLYNNVDGMQYMKDCRFTTDQVNILFRFRTRMADVRNNFRNKYNNDALCPLCSAEQDTQMHLFNCQKIIQSSNNSNMFMDDEGTEIQYGDIFQNDTNKLLKVANVLCKIMQTRKDIIEHQEL